MKPSLEPKLSIITPVLNGERFIGSCVRNVREQNCPQLEHLIIDGGSTDRTLEIVRGFMDFCPHIRLDSERGLNQSAAMNKGIALARGEILGLLNADDYYEPHVLNRILKLFEERPCPSFLVGNCNVRNERDEVIEVNRPKKLKLRDLLIGNQFNPHPINSSAYFCHKSLHRRTGPYRTDEEYGMDLDFILRAVQRARVQYVDETWGNFRFMAGTKTFNDFSSGEAEVREKRIFEPFFQSLSPIHKVYVQCFRRLLQCQLEMRGHLGEAAEKVKKRLVVPGEQKNMERETVTKSIMQPLEGAKTGDH